MIRAGHPRCHAITVHHLLHLTMGEIERRLGAVDGLDETIAILVPADDSHGEPELLSQAVLSTAIPEQLARMNERLELCRQLLKRGRLRPELRYQLFERHGLSRGL
jgi:hypothetical protein